MNWLLEIANDHKIVAHRGMFDKTIPENSMSAFKKALDHNYGIELDVHLTKDGDLAVFHDHTLTRMCHKKLYIEDMAMQELKECKLKNTEETIPSLKDVFKLINGQVPLYIELKCKDNALQLAKTLLRQMKQYNNPVIFVGFEYSSLKFLQSYGYPVCMSSILLPPPPKEDFIPNGMLTNISFAPLLKAVRKHYPPFICWTVSTPFQKWKAKKICPAAIYNTKDFRKI